MIIGGLIIMKKFKVYDMYEGKMTIGYVDTLSEVKKLAREYYEETDGECSIWYAELNPETLKYKFSDRKFLSIC